MINGVLNTPYMLQLAYGWTSIANKSNIVAVLLLVPAAYFLVPRYGTTGAAMLFLLLNLGYLVILPGITLRKLLPGNTWIWMRSAVFLPLAATGLVGAVLRIGLDRPTARPAAFLLLAFAGLAFLAAALWATRGPGGPFSAAKSAILPMILKLGV